MSAIHMPVKYYLLVCHNEECGMRTETREVQYERCPRCHGTYVSSMTRERWEQAEQPLHSSDEAAAQRAANKALERAQ